MGREEIPFKLADLPGLQKRASDAPWTINDVFAHIAFGSFPELFDNRNLSQNNFYESYVRSYLERDVAKLINVNKISYFRSFMEGLASFTGQELVYSTLANAVGIDEKTVASWVNILVGGNIIYLLEPYNELSIVKRARKRPKVYFTDTGLACFLARLESPATLLTSYFAGGFFETYVINEIIKSYKNNDVPASFYYYRDSNQNEIDLLILTDGTLYPIEIKTRSKVSSSDVKAFKKIKGTRYKVGKGAVICNADNIYPLTDDCYAIPVSAL